MYITDEVREVLSPFSIYFNGIDLTDYLFPKQDAGRGLPAREISTITVPGRAGSYITSKRTPERVITQEVLIACENAEELRKNLEELAEVLHTEQPAPLQFADEIDRTYYAIYAGADEGYELEGFHTATISFLCADPYKYAAPKTLPFKDGAVTVRNYGSVEASPTVKATAKADITYLDVFNDDGYMRIGQPVETGNVKYNPKTKLLNEQFAVITGWTAAGTSVDGGIVSGLMTSNGFSFGADNFGTSGGAVWTGPALKKSVTGGPITDFEVEWNIVFTNPTSRHRGRMELYLLDDQSAVIGKVAMKRTGGSKGNQVEIRIGSATLFHFYVSYAGATGNEWYQFRGVLRLSRKDNVWNAYIAQVDEKTKKHTSRYNPKPFVDSKRLYTAALAQVQVHIAKDDTLPASTMRANHLDVYRLNPKAAGAPVIASVDDTIELNFKDSLISINGEPRPDLKDFGASFFKLPKGSSTLLIEPAESLTAEIEVAEAFR